MSARKTERQHSNMANAIPLKAFGHMLMDNVFRTAVLTAGIFASLGWAPVLAQTEILAVGIDRKFAYDDAGRRQALAPGRDMVAFYELADPANPVLIGTVALENSIVGPPTNIAVTPDQKLALVASALRSEAQADGSFKAVPSDELSVIDLTIRPPKLIKTIKVGSQPSGITIAKSGRIALVANRDGRSVSALSIDGKEVTVKSTTPLTDSVVSVAITPDGKTALAAKFGVHKLAVLTVTGEGVVTDTKADLPVGLYPWTVTISEDGTRALVTNIGANAASDGHAKTVSVIELGTQQPKVIQHVSVGDAPEGVSFTRDGRLAAVTILQGSYDAPKGAWWRNDAGVMTILRIGKSGASVASSVSVGAFPEGVAFSADGRFAYVGNFASSTLSIVPVSKDGAAKTPTTLQLPGPPASLRIGSR